MNETIKGNIRKFNEAKEALAKHGIEIRDYDFRTKKNRLVKDGEFVGYLDLKNKCPQCGHEMVKCEHEDVPGYSCFNERCSNERHYPEMDYEQEIQSLRDHFGWTEEEATEYAAFLRKLSPHLADACIRDYQSQVVFR